MNAGARALASRQMSCGEVVEALGIVGFEVRSRSTASAWAKGTKLPALQARRALERALCIPCAAWDEDAPPPAAPVAVRPPTPAANPREPNLDPTAAELAKELLARIQLYREQSETTALGIQARKVLFEMERNAIAQYAKLSGQAATEREILSSPHFRNVLDEMMAALAPYPEALRALRVALSDTEGT